jgi:hypothetical protein
MTSRTGDGNKRGNQEEARKARLAEQLRANLQRRKAQARSRRAGEADLRPNGLMGADRDHSQD